MYSKLVVGLAMAGAATCAEIVRRDADGGGHGHASHGSGGGHSSGGHSSGGHSASHSHSAPSSGYSEPAASYSAPSAGYGAPSAGYGAPSAGYGAPSSSYGAPSSSYGGGSSSGYGGGGYDVGGYDDGRFDLSVIIIPLLVLFGLSLLFPTIVNINATGRRKREAGDEDVSTLTDVVERVNDIYMAVVESEECLERVACEIGGLAEDVGIRENSLTQMAEAFVPSRYKAYYKQFQSGQNCHKIKCGNIF